MAWVTKPSNITISSLGGSATSIATTNNDHSSSAVHKLEWVCSYSSSGVLSISHFVTVTSSWGTYSTQNSRCSVTVNGSIYYFLEPGTDFSDSTTNHRKQMGGTGTWNIGADTTSITVNVSEDFYSGGYGPGSKLTASFTITVPKRQTDPVAGTTRASYSGNTFSISWSGFQAGTNNPIDHYELWYQESTNNSTWGTRVLLTGNTTSTSYSWTGGTWNRYYRFCAVAIGANGGYSSTTAYSSSVRKYATTCGAPTSITVNSSNVAPGATVTVSWSGASSGTNNSISSYYVEWGYADGGWDYNKTVNSTSTSSSTSITLPSDRRGVYIDIRVTTRGSAGSGYYSTPYREDDVIYIRGYTACGAPTTITIRSGSSTTSSIIDTKECGSGNFYIHWNAGTAGTDNSIVGYTVYYRNKTAGTTAWSKLRDVTTLYTYDSRSESNDYEYTVQTRGSAGSSYYSTYGTYTKSIGMIPTNPTACALTAITNISSLSSFTAQGQTGLFAELLDPANNTTNLGIRFSGGTGATSYNIRYGVYEINENAQSEHIFTSALPCGYVDWTVLDMQSAGVSYYHGLNMSWHGRIVQYYANSVGNNGRVSTEYFMSKPVYLPGGYYLKQSNNYKRGLPKLKVNGAYKLTAAIWTKVDDVWKQSF